MRLPDLTLKTNYRKGEDDIANDFYLPCMSMASRYDRAVGFFSSAIYVIAWPVLKDFVRRGSTMRLVCSPVLTDADITAMTEGYSTRDEEENAVRLLRQIQEMLNSPYLHKPTKVLASLLAIGAVDIRIAFMPRTSSHKRIFHEKLGLFHDDSGNAVDFKGSMNETWAGLAADGNLESIDVFLSWEHARESQRVREDEEHFEKLWTDNYEGVTTRPFPLIAREELVHAADPTNWPEIVDEICRDMEAAQRFSVPTKRQVLRPHQSHALLEWERLGRRGIFEHATGSGKTFIALCAIRDSLTRKETPIVLVPSDLLLQQWNHEIAATLADLNPAILVCGGGQSRWRDEDLLGPWTRTGDRARIVLATMQTASTPDFRSGIRQGEHLFLVADEVHRLGSQENQKLFTLRTGPRLGLSATPRRAGDPVGTEAVFTYFNGVVPPPFTLHDAIASGTLTAYMYHVHSVQLGNDEQDAWNVLTKRIRQYTAQNASLKEKGGGCVDEQRVKLLLIQRARILKSAKNKVALAAQVLQTHYEAGQRWIVYCDTLDKLSDVLAETRRIGLNAGEYHSAMIGNREQTLSLFERSGGILVSIRCLDEGVDIPLVSHALILASSRNPREFIQRRGRVLRNAPGKNLAHIHDCVVMPQQGDDEDPSLSILLGEMARAVEFGRGALNPSAVTDLERIALQYTRDYHTLLGNGFEEDE